MWIARNKSGYLWFFGLLKPHYFEDCGWVTDSNACQGEKLDDDLFPEVTFENSPVEVEVHTFEHLKELLHIEYSRGWEDGESKGFQDGIEYDDEEDK